MQFGPACRDLFVERDRFLQVALVGQKLGAVLVDQPPARKGASGARVMLLRLLGPTVGEIEHAALELEPRERAHLLGGQLVRGLGVKPVGARGIAKLELQPGEARERGPGAVLPDHSLVAGRRVAHPAVLDIEVGEKRLAFRAVACRRDGVENMRDVGETVQMKGKPRLEQPEIAGMRDERYAAVDQRLDTSERLEISGQQRAPVARVDIRRHPLGVGRRCERCISVCRDPLVEAPQLLGEVGAARHRMRERDRRGERRHHGSAR